MDATAFRLARQHLRRRSGGGAVDVARQLCGLHAQVLSSADLIVWARARGRRPGALQTALWEERSLVKTWLMRGTLHLVPAADLPLYVGVLDNRGEYRHGAYGPAGPEDFDRWFGHAPAQRAVGGAPRRARRGGAEDVRARARPRRARAGAPPRVASGSCPPSTRTCSSRRRRGRCRPSGATVAREAAALARHLGGELALTAA